MAILEVILDTDTVALSSSLVIDQHSIGVASSSTGFQNVDGILGIGPTYLTAGAASHQSQVPTVTDNLYSQKKITKEVIGISYSFYTGSITYASITKTSLAKYHWRLDQSVTYGSSGSNVLSLSSTAGILETGTTLVLLATDAFNRYKQVTGANHDGATGLLTISNDLYKKLESLFFNVGNKKFELTANAQIWKHVHRSESSTSLSAILEKTVVNDSTSLTATRSSSVFTECMTQPTSVSVSQTLRTARLRRTDPSHPLFLPTPIYRWL